MLRLKQICNFDPATGASAKLDRLEADLEEVAASGRKAIVFSQWVRHARGACAAACAASARWSITAACRRGKRDAVIRRFRESPDAHVLLISYGAGGVGLNLQFANYVFLFDRWWNPAVEDQAINRAHRIGVADPVIVTRMLTLGTIEERIERILEEKRELFDTIFSAAEGPARLGLSQEELFGLFDLRFPGGPAGRAVEHLRILKPRRRTLRLQPARADAQPARTPQGMLLDVGAELDRGAGGRRRSERMPRVVVARNWWNCAAGPLRKPSWSRPRISFHVSWLR